MLDLSAEVAEQSQNKTCSERHLSEADCNRWKVDNLEEMRKRTQEIINDFDEKCKKSALLEDECVKAKQDWVKKTFAEYKK
jgi:Uri superfamily endonuclease